MKKDRYIIHRYGRWHFAILDREVGLLVRQGVNIQYDKPLNDSDNKLLLFNKKIDAENYIKKHLLGELI